MNCPACESTDVRTSRYRPEDGLWRSLFFTAYRCRECGRRFERLTHLPLLLAIVTAGLSLAFGAGFFLGGARTDHAQPARIAASNPDLSTSSDLRDIEDAVAPLKPELALAASAQGGDPEAQYQLGVVYLKGNGAEKNPTLAYKWIEKAAEQGYAEAQYALGAMHHAGRDALQSFALAFKWFERAAQQNHAEAQYSLGIMYRAGQGMPADKPQAYIWFNLAAAQGHERARDARDQLLPSLTAEQVLSAQRAAQDWRPVAAPRRAEAPAAQRAADGGVAAAPR